MGLQEKWSFPLDFFLLFFFFLFLQKRYGNLGPFHSHMVAHFQRHSKMKLNILLLVVALISSAQVCCDAAAALERHMKDDVVINEGDKCETDKDCGSWLWCTSGACGTEIADGNAQN